MTKKIYVLMSFFVVLAMLLAACGTPAVETTVPPTEEVVPPTEEVVEPTEPVAIAFKACQVTDTGGIDDQSFNATAWKGIEDAVAAYGIEGKYLESQQQTDYEKNINAFLQEGCNIIIPVGFLLGDATKVAAEANPEVPFAIVDFGYDPVIPNVRGSGYKIDQATFLAGYLAAGMTTTGKVGTYGGIQIPPVTAFMDGYYLGIQAYNKAHGTSVELLGWDPASQTGLFAGNFESTDDGRRLGESLLDEGADIIMPVAGPVGGGTLAVLKERGTGLLIGVDNDWSAPYAYPDYADFILASALKNMDAWVMDSIKQVMDGTFKGEQYLGTLENNGVGLKLGSVWADKVPADLKAEIETLQADIVAGNVATAWGEVKAPAGFKACQVTDTGGIDDQSFNATAWKGIEDAVAAFGVEGKYLESQQQTDYEKNINAFLQEGCNIIVPVGFLLGDATKVAAEANPEVPFAIVDFGYDPVIPNVRGSGYQIDQATFLAGYLAAGMTKTGKVGTYGGIQIPPVTAFMDGFWLGVQKYNEVHGTSVEVLGWDPATQTGLFAGNFESTDDGRRLGESLLDEGADIIMPVAGPVGGGTLAVLKERGTGLLIGVDNDWSAPYAYPDYADFILASALKNMDAWVLESIREVILGNFKGEQYLGTLENNGVGLQYGSVWADKVPAELKAEIDALKADIVAGTIATLPTTP
jgi:basic membrane protein A